MDRPDQGSEVRTRLPAGGRWIRSYGGLRLPKKPKDSAILGVETRRFCPRFCPRVAIRVYPGSRIEDLDRRSAGGFPRT
jgi:hypothetical protein